MTVDGTLLRSTMANWVSGVAIVTTAIDNVFHGMTISSMLSVSVNPLVMAISANCKSRTCSSILSSGYFAINILAQGQSDIAVLFADKNKQDERFNGLETSAASTGAPLIANCVANIDCSVTDSHVAGDHIIILGTPVKIIQTDAQPLVYGLREFGRFLPDS